MQYRTLGRTGLRVSEIGLGSGGFEKVIDHRRTKDIIDCALANGVAITVMKGFAAGLLLRENESPFGRAMTSTQCIRYCLDRPAVASVMAGAVTVEELRAALRFCDPAENRDYSSFLASVPSASFRGHCMYCGHCAPCTSVIDVAAVNRCVDLAQVQSCVPPTVREHYAQLAHHAEDCVECGACMTRCLFGVDVIKKMRDAKEIFGY